MNKKVLKNKYPVFTCCDRRPSYIVSFSEDSYLTMWYVCDQHVKEKFFRSAAINRYMYVEPITSGLSKLLAKSRSELLIKVNPRNLGTKSS